MNKGAKILIVAIVGIFLSLIVSGCQDKKYTVVFDSSGGSQIAAIKVNEGEKIKQPNNPVKDGYIFISWLYDGKNFDFDTKIKRDITLIADWQEVKNEVEYATVIFDTDGGSQIEGQIIKKNGIPTKPSDPVKDGYIFDGWTLNGNDYKFDKAILENSTIVAKWSKVIEVNNQNTGSTSKSNTKPSVSKPQSGSINSNKPKAKYTVTFNSNGGSSVSTQTVVEGNKAVAPSNPTRAGYSFSGWLLNGRKYNFSNAVTGNITLTASWSQKTYTIKQSKVDDYSPDRILTVYENGTKINVKSVNYSDGTKLCSGNNMTVNMNEIIGESKFIVVLNNGTQVNATLNN